jgi:shikimate kinase
MSDASTRNVVLMGLMGSGKTTIGRALARTLNRPFLDNDEVLEQRTGRSAAEIARADGVSALHDAELDALEAGLACDRPAVVAAAAAVIEAPGIAELLRPHTVVYLHADPGTLASRVRDEHAAHRRIASLPKQYATRDGLYRSVANVVVETAGRAVDDIVAQITRSI